MKIGFTKKKKKINDYIMRNKNRAQILRRKKEKAEKKGKAK